MGYRYRPGLPHRGRPGGPLVHPLPDRPQVRQRGRQQEHHTIRRVSEARQCEGDHEYA